MRNIWVAILTLVGITSSATAGEVSLKPEFRIWLSHNGEYAKTTTSIPVAARTLPERGTSYTIPDGLDGSGGFWAGNGSVGILGHAGSLAFGGGATGLIPFKNRGGPSNSIDMGLTTGSYALHERIGIGWYAEAGYHSIDKEMDIDVLLGYSQVPTTLAAESRITTYTYFDQPRYDKCTFIGYWHCPAQWSEENGSTLYQRTDLASGQLRRISFSVSAVDRNTHIGSIMWVSYTMSPWGSANMKYPDLRIANGRGHFGVNIALVFRP